MEKKATTPITPFDEWTIPNELHTLKLLLPYTPAASQQALGILIKVFELQNTIQYFNRQKNLLHEQDFSSGFSSPMEMLEEIAPYLPPEQSSMLETFRNMMNIMDMVQMMQAFSDNMENASTDDNHPRGKSSFQDSPGSDKNNSFSEPGNFEQRNSSTNSEGTNRGFDPMQLVMGMLSPEQRDMFEMYQTMFSQPEEPAATEPSSNADATSDLSSHTPIERNRDIDAEQSKMETPDIEPQNFQTERIDTDYE